MQRYQILPPLTLILGGCGGYLNHMMHTTGIDPDSLLLKPSSHYPTTLLFFSALVAITLFIGVMKGTSLARGANCLRLPSTLALAVWSAGAFLLLCSAGLTALQCLEQMHLRGDGYAVPFPIVLFMAVVLELAASIGLLVMVKYLSVVKSPSLLGVMSTFPAFASLPWLLYCYQQNTRNPSLSLYGYQLMGFSFCVIALYLLSTLFYDKAGYPRLTAFFSLMGCYLLLSAVATGLALYLVITLMAFALVLLGNATVILINMDRKKFPKRLEGMN